MVLIVALTFTVQVVKLISGSSTVLRVQVGDGGAGAGLDGSSSEDEGGLSRPRPPHRRPPARQPRPHDLWHVNNPPGPGAHQSDSERERLPSPRKHQRSNSADSSFVEGGGPGRSSAPRHQVELEAGQELSIGGELDSFLARNLSQLRNSIKQHNARQLNIDLNTASSK